ncbi:uncharacterized protein BHQ10_001563 [Talaromyces amestolkiae]|uniref:Uncharacterized protein n=1 Tax=Talaromyces amestolkiae TaxID=1196081 RepID=A0A364KPW0_TALAM|nr:uncharacterized protein BHQ10_001563 [Talaromyces amestolkiae]RAO65551.1 hypothetical protein BHQ10_001563 [Talaromyces amestolkiae]
MRYYSTLVCLVAVSLCFTPHQRNDETPLGQGKQLIDTDDVRMNQVRGNRDRLIEDVRVCGQFLNGLNVLSGEFSNDTASLDFVKACERVVAILDQAVDRSMHRHVQSREQRNLPALIRKNRPDLEEIELQKTFSTEFSEEILARDAISSFPDTARHRLKHKYRRDEICEDRVCEANRLNELCNAEKIDPSVAQTCKMCYPVRNAQLINAHCQAKWRRERKAFYVVSFVLIGVTLVSGLILYLRRRYLRAKNPRTDELAESGINPPGELYYYDGPRSILPSERGSSLTVNCSPEASRRENSNKYHNSWDENEGDVIRTSFAQRRLRQLGILSRTGRKRIHDLFDLEALQSRRGTVKGPQQHSDDSVRVPVMPWAPNATIRSSSRSSSCVRPADSTSPETVRLRGSSLNINKDLC